MNAIVLHIFINPSNTVNCTNNAFHLPKVNNSLLSYVIKQLDGLFACEVLDIEAEEFHMGEAFLEFLC